MKLDELREILNKWVYLKVRSMAGEGWVSYPDGKLLPLRIILVQPEGCMVVNSCETPWIINPVNILDLEEVEEAAVPTVDG